MPTRIGTPVQVWGMLAQTMQPLLDTVPVLRTPIDFVQRWFTNVR